VKVLPPAIRIAIEASREWLIRFSHDHESGGFKRVENTHRLPVAEYRHKNIARCLSPPGADHVGTGSLMPQSDGGAESPLSLNSPCRIRNVSAGSRLEARQLETC
jgi:hypothetical protein